MVGNILFIAADILPVCFVSYSGNYLPLWHDPAAVSAVGKFYILFLIFKILFFIYTNVTLPTASVHAFSKAIADMKRDTFLWLTVTAYW